MGGSMPGGRMGYSRLEEAPSLELRSRGAGGLVYRDESPPPSEPMVDRPIGPGETLSAIALRYSLPLTELKRLNGLVTEQDFYARSSLKIPSRHYQHAETLLIDDSCPSTSQKATTSSSLSTQRPAQIGLEDAVSVGSVEEQRLASPSSAEALRCGVSISSSSGASTPATKAKSLFRSVDATLEQAKNKTEALLEAEDSEDASNVFNPSLERQVAAEAAQSAALERNLSQYLVAVLLCALLLIPIGALLYHFVLFAEYELGEEAASGHVHHGTKHAGP